MKKLATALLIIFIVLLTTQFVRHAYERMFYNEESVLDKYNKKTADILIDRSLSLKELSMIYADAEKRIRVFESGKSKKELTQYDKNDDPYTKKKKIEELINNREADYRMVRELVMFWITGVLFIICGSFVYLKYDTWIGAPLVISGFTEMIWKTGPLFFMPETNIGSSMILNIKIIFTALTLAGVITYWIFFKKYFEK